jgi:hypothetical protein
MESRFAHEGAPPRRKRADERDPLLAKVPADAGAEIRLAVLIAGLR